MIDLVKNSPSPHARSPFFINKKYVWMDCDVLNYDP